MRPNPPFGRYSAYAEQKEFLDVLNAFSEKAKKDLGCYGFSVVSIESMPSATVVIHSYSNLPVAWSDAYRKNNLALVDPLLNHSLGSTSRLFWNESVLQSSPEFYRVAKDYNFHSGALSVF